MSINISELIWTVICFFVLLVVLKKLLFDPLVSFMLAVVVLMVALAISPSHFLFFKIGRAHV